MENLIKEVVNESFYNLNTVLDAMSDEGQKNLDIWEKDEDKLMFTSFGSVVKLKNPEGNSFFTLVMDTDDVSIFRRRIVESAESIKKNFKECAK
ncbi:hypothetical protein N9W99_03720 [Gammaproteobacteria bacterium]|nr:hypothetical protein [Gammaproteobacteria bacterium]